MIYAGLKAVIKISNMSDWLLNMARKMQLNKKQMKLMGWHCNWIEAPRYGPIMEI